jgi:hypothetical protein
MEITAAFQAKQAGRRREVDVTRAALRLTDEALAETARPPHPDRRPVR